MGEDKARSIINKNDNNNNNSDHIDEEILRYVSSKQSSTIIYSAV